jgi:hypothetical protein
VASGFCRGFLTQNGDYGAVGDHIHACVAGRRLTCSVQLRPAASSSLWASRIAAFQVTRGLMDHAGHGLAGDELAPAGTLPGPALGWVWLPSMHYVWFVFVVSRAGGGAAMATDPSVPEAPDPVLGEIWSGAPHVVLDGERYAIGWQRFPAEKGGPAYVTVRRGVLGGRRVLGRYPLTGDGWARAWAAFARLDPVSAEKTRAALGRFYAARPPGGLLALVPGLVLGAIDPLADGFVVGQVYDLRFGEDSLQIARSGSPEATAEYRYADVAAVQVTGFERVLAISKIGYSFGGHLTWNSDDSWGCRTHLRVQTFDRTLDFWHAAQFPENFGRWLKPVNRAIRQAWLTAAADKAERQTDWLVSELSRLAERLEHDTLTRSDFDLLKARIIGGY